MRGCAVLLVAWVALPITSLPGQNRPAGPPPGVLVDVGGYRLHLVCAGTPVASGPTVILDAGAGGYSAAWSAVQRLVPGIRSCAYDRAGWGWSDPGPGPRTITQETTELEMLLRRAGVKAPFVLVGHSYGGLLVRRYAATHPNEIAGVVLVDPAHEDSRLFYTRQGGWLRVREQGRGRAVPAPRTLAPGDATVSFYDPDRDFWSEEFQAFHDARVANPRMLGTLPVRILAGDKEPPPPGTAPELWEQLRAERREQLDGLITLSASARVIRDPTSGHDIPASNPALIAACIAEVVNAATGTRTMAPMGPCASPQARE
jgi:pimeloyl-ACP methyl ester carboxylesterase